jgi:hypothetical protein
MIVKQGSQYVLKTKDGKHILGKHATKGEAEAQERAVEAHKHSDDKQIMDCAECTGGHKYDSVDTLHIDSASVLDSKGAIVTAEGWLRARGMLTRTGVFEYMKADGTTRRELRLPEEVFSAEALKSFELVPMVNGHPSEPLNAENTKRLQIGTIGEPKRDGELVTANLVVTDQTSVKQILGGRNQLSCGYTADCEEKSGVHNGERYDSIQRNIRGNHVALVDQARGGPNLRVRLDSAFAANPDCVVESLESALDNPSGVTLVTKMTVDGVDYEMSESASQAVEKSLKALNEKLAESAKQVESAKAESATHSARADGFEAELKKANEALKSAPEQIRAEIKARVELEKLAGTVLGETKLDGMDNQAVKVAVVEKLKGDKLDAEKAKNPAYVDAAFDFAMSTKSAFSGAGKQVDASKVKLDEKTSDAKAARAKMIADYGKFNPPGSK